MLHVELRQGRNQTRAFNLGEEEALRRFLLPFVGGRTLLHADREWEPRRTKLTVYEAPELGVEQMGMGRGWANVQKTGREVTTELLARARGGGAVSGRAGGAGTAGGSTFSRDELDRLEERLLGRLAAGAVPLAEVVALAGDLLAGRRVSERLAAAELAVWELLHHGEAALLDGGQAVAREGWQARLLEWDSWGQATTSPIRLARSESDANR